MVKKGFFLVIVKKTAHNKQNYKKKQSEKIMKMKFGIKFGFGGRYKHIQKENHV